MPALFLFIFRFFRLLMSGHQAVALENAALRLQLAAFQRKRKRPVRRALGSRATTIRLARGLFGMQVSGRAHRTQVPIGSRPTITGIVTIPATGKATIGAGIAMTTSAGSAMTAAYTAVGTGTTTTTTNSDRRRDVLGGLSLVYKSRNLHSIEATIRRLPAPWRPGGSNLL